jgi:hypothetical protein
LFHPQTRKQGHSGSPLLRIVAEEIIGPARQFVLTAHWRRHIRPHKFQPQFPGGLPHATGNRMAILPNAGSRFRLGERQYCFGGRDE